MEISQAPRITASPKYGSSHNSDQSSNQHSNQSPSQHPTQAATTNRGADRAQLAQLAEEQAAVQKLARRDREVRAHEQAHASVGGSHAGHPNYQFTSGPNGVRYASGGHVSIDISPVKGDPQATVEKMQQVQRAALAPANPSAQDRAVASKATAQAAEARAELQRSNADERIQNSNSEQTRIETKAEAKEPVKPNSTRAPEFGSTSGSQIDTTV